MRQCNDGTSKNYDSIMCELQKIAEGLAKQKIWSDKAIEVNKKIAELNYKDINSRTRLAKCYIEKNEKEKAISLYKEVLTLEPSNIIAKNQLQRIQDADINIVFETNKKMAESNPNDAASRINLANCYIYKNKIEKAIELLEIVLSFEPNNSDAKSLFEKISPLIKTTSILDYRYINHCWNCRATITDGMERCPKCNWFVCPECGACGCGY